MNVLILTPDAVGSTLLQRLLTIYMQFHEFDRPVINLHELTNGLSKFYSSDFNQEIISRRGTWGYHQTLSEIVDILESVDHYKTARLAQYHIRGREDTLADQLPFYRYLNDNFFVIACRRENLFEHILSHGINDITKKLNVYTPSEKINSFYGIYRGGIEIQPEQLLTHLSRYSDYIEWCDRHFSVGSYFYYEKNLKNIEKYILGLPVFGAQSQKITWASTFGQEFEDWNRCHYYNSDIGAIAMSAPEALLQITNSSPAPAIMQNLLPVAHRSFLDTHKEKYNTANSAINQMQQLGIINSSVPIKKQTLLEKLFVIRNLDQCIDVFNEWIEFRPELGSTVNIEQLKIQAQEEYDQQWNPIILSNAAPHVQLPN